MNARAVSLAALAFALYVTCPRMTAMIYAQARQAKVDPVVTIALGCLISIPLFLVIFYALAKWGPGAAVALAAAFDALAAVLLGELDLKAGIELAVITAFVYAGIRLAPRIASAIVGGGT